MDKNLKELTLEFIGRRQEGDYWDFKQKWHSNTESLIHDIICFTNTIHVKDCYLIFGVSDEYQIVGVESDENRKTQAMVVDTIDNCKFAGDNKPQVSLQTIKIDEKEIDIIIIYNHNNTPVYIEKKNKRHNNLREGFIYSRYLDRNTPKDQNSNYFVVEELWKKRFGLNRLPLEEFNELLKDKENWICSRESFYYKYRPEFTITEVDEDSNNEEVYSYLMTNTKTSYRELELRYKGTILDYYQGATLDSGRYNIICPEKGFFVETIELYCRDFLPFRYYIKNSLAYNLHNFLFNQESEDARYAKRRFDTIISIFESEEELNEFTKYLKENRKQFDEIFSKYLNQDVYIETNDDLIRKFTKKEIAASKAVKEFLCRFRENI